MFQLKLQSNKLLPLAALVFFSGAIVLLVELVGFRMFAPYFGNTLYASSSVLGVVLAALAFGYIWGGQLGDKNPTRTQLSVLFLLSAVSLVFLRVGIDEILPRLGYELFFTVGPLILSLILLAPVSFFLGSLAPFVVAFAHASMPERGIGKLTGELSFASTIGSIVGSLISGFVLLPRFSQTSLIGVSALLVLLVALALAYQNRSFFKKIIPQALVLLVILYVWTFMLSADTEQGEVARLEGTYSRISVIDTTYKGEDTRFLRLDRNSSSAMYLNSDELVFDYTKFYELYTLLERKSNNTLVLGAGAFSVPKALLADEELELVEVIDIEPKLYPVSKEYFKLPDDARLVFKATDARRHLVESDLEYDLIFGDVYQTLYSIPEHLATKEFFELTRSRLSTDGIFMVNVIGDLARTQPSHTLSIYKTFAEVFPENIFVATEDNDQITTQNVVLIGFTDSEDKETVLANTNDIVDEYVKGQLQNKTINPSRFSLEQALVLRDDTASLQKLSAELLSRVYDSSDLNGNEMLAMIHEYVELGPQIPGTDTHLRSQAYIISNLEAAGVQVVENTFSEDGMTYNNIIGRINPEVSPRHIIGVHYDTKATADEDRRNPAGIVPGAHDGASGVAVLLELARYWQNEDLPEAGVDLIFFDGEEGDPRISAERDLWRPIGSEHFAFKALKDFYPEQNPESVLVVDMVCDKDLKLQVDEVARTFNPEFTEQVKQSFFDLGLEDFLSDKVSSIHDDHRAFIPFGIPSQVIIDFTYEHWHTVADTPDKCSAESLLTTARIVDNFVRK